MILHKMSAKDSTQISALVGDCLKALYDEKVVLCPTDGLPGLSFHPQSLKAQNIIAQLKERSPHKTFLGLCHSFTQAQRFWQPLPEAARDKLTLHWPGPLTVVWRASDLAPKALCSEQKMIALRVGLFPQAHSWVTQVLQKLGLPLPSTSVNSSGDVAIHNWKDACLFLSSQLQENEYFIPKYPGVLCPPASPNQPSTIVALEDDGSFRLIRQGCFPSELL